ncbi:uncharacterized protein LOC126723973 [Quercus robur]|uniref:uncharacterized protein LOC126723973 n=1 Tax=Quercus robur TaxID=38942 RepID=UPI0021613F71|nr:uncharacterized protein LOC126723973 [Quercus robur]XP_050283963.1 uncharacterized protein LOC126723973 [Quercus robur]XP_050283964.1 uncharacterized protein LOC126723973 [Quercus robur]
MAELEHFKDKAGRLQEELQKKTHEFEEGRQLRAQSQQQIVWNDTEMSKNKQCLKEYEEDNNLLMDKIIGLKLKNNELMVNHGGESGEVAEGRDSITSPDHGNKVSDTSEAPCDTAEVNNICFNGSLEDVKEANLIQATSSNSPTSSFLIESNSPSNVKFGTFSGTKRAAPCSRNTWFLQCLVEKVDELEDELTGKKQQVADGKVFAQNLVKKIDWLLSKTSNNLHLLRENIEDKELLMSKLECLEDKVGILQQELQKKSHEVEEGSKLQNQLLKTGFG